MIRIIGVGSPFGADRLGWEAIDHLQSRAPDGCELIKLDRPGSGLLRYLEGVEQVVIIDAVLQGVAAGEVAMISRETLADSSTLTSCHGFGVADALALAQQLGDLPQRIDLIGIGAGEDLRVPPGLNTAALESELLRLDIPL
ncbi:MAG: hydrogenase maturation protease [Candidatus Thiodiazotropha sp.]|jgi:hydrogenase maturation protease